MTRANTVPRTQGLAKLERSREHELIKVVTGLRRCGKSVLLQQFQAKLREQGVDAARIQALNFEDASAASLSDWRLLHDHVIGRCVPGRMNYVFLDEVQNVPEFERAVDSLFLRPNIDLYITGSNAHLLSGELATRLSGRYVEIHLLPFSFAEYLSAWDEPGSLPRRYQDYVTLSSLPYTLRLRQSGGPQDGAALIRDYLDGVYHTVLVKDVVTRAKIADMAMLERVARFMFDNIGGLCSVKKITDTIISSGRRISVNTVEHYLSALRDSYILYRLGRYDIKGKQHLKTGDKYYLADPGLRFYLLGSGMRDAGRVLENVVFLELKRRDWELSVGKAGDTEVDFVAQRGGEREYYQVALSVRDEATLDRELRPLRAIRDSYPKFILTLDDDPPANEEGIRRLNALDWLLE